MVHVPDFAAVRDALLDMAGGAYSLGETAELLGLSFQDVHRQIYEGRMLGMFLDDEIVVPRLQILDGHVLPGIDRVAMTFQLAEAGAWSALQFLVEQDPNLGKRPIDALKAVEVEAVEHAARAYLNVDEE
jgi:hypothetical protein